MSDNTIMTGYLKVILGCMFSGKTTELIKNIIVTRRVILEAVLLIIVQMIDMVLEHQLLKHITKIVLQMIRVVKIY